MELQKQVCTLEQAKKLFQLGIMQESYFYWADTIDCPQFGITHGHFFLSDSEYSAYNLSELGIMLPNEIRGHSLYHVLGHCNNGHISGYSKDGRDYWIMCGPFKPEAKARASLLIYLLENGYTTAEEINQRLNNA